jgi:thiamine biosynthesis lipoprotein
MNFNRLRILFCKGILHLLFCLSAVEVVAQTSGPWMLRAQKMGTIFQLTCFSDDSLHAAQTMQEAFILVDSLNAILSNYLPDSEISRLAATAGTHTWVPVSDVLWDVLNHSQVAFEKSFGSFDITAGPCIRLWRRARQFQQKPDEAQLQNARELVGFRWVAFDSARQAVMLQKAGMSLDLGGIGKGYAADQILALLARRGLPQAMVDAGGDLTLGHAPPGEKGWPVWVQHREEAAEGLLYLARCAVATSGDLYQSVTLEGKRYGHLVDPATCMGLTRQRAATVIAPDGTTADWLASALLVTGHRKAGKVTRGMAHTHFLLTFADRSGNGFKKKVSGKFPHFTKA